MTASVYTRVRAAPTYIESVTGDKPTSNISVGSIYIDVAGIIWRYQGSSVWVIIQNGAGSDNLTTGVVSVPTTAGGTQIVAARPGRKGVLVSNNGSNIVYIGQGSITSSNAPLNPGIAKYYALEGQIKGLSASGTQSVSYEEIY